jgi:hypothetical protein
MTNSPERNRKPSSRAEKKKNRLNIQSVHAPKPVKKTLSRAAKQAAQGRNTPSTQKTNTKRRNIITIASIALVVVLIAAFVYYLIAIMPLQRVLLTVGDENVSTGYFLKRAVANSNGNVSTTLQLMTAELVIKQQAASQGVAAVTAQDIDDYLRKEAITSLSSAAANDTTTTTATTSTTDTTTTTSSTTTPTATTPTTISDADFKKWFNTQLDNTGLSAKEYREVAGREIQRQRLTAILTADIPSSIQQVHLWAAVFNSNAAALAAKAKIDSGTDWGTVAAAAATAIGSTTTTNGDLGWWPYDAIDAQLEDKAKTLATTLGVCSDPIAYQSSSASSSTTTSYVLLKVSEITPADAPMPITASQISVMQTKALNNWLNSKASGLTITFHGLNGSTTLDNQTSTWLDYQVQKLIKKRPTETTTTVLSTTTPTTTQATSGTTSTTTTGTSP